MLRIVLYLRMASWELPGGPVVKNLPSMEEKWVQFLVGELRSSAAKQNKYLFSFFLKKRIHSRRGKERKNAEKAT